MSLPHTGETYDCLTMSLSQLFGSGAMVPGTGIMLNNTQQMFDPHPGMPQ